MFWHVQRVTALLVYEHPTSSVDLPFGRIAFTAHFDRNHLRHMCGISQVARRADIAWLARFGQPRLTHARGPIQPPIGPQIVLDGFRERLTCGLRRAVATESL